MPKDALRPFSISSFLYSNLAMVDLIVLAVCLTMTEAKHINPTVAECVVALQRLIEVVLSDHGETLH